MKKFITICLIILVTFAMHAQERMTQYPVSQSDSRIFVEIEHSETAFGGFQFVNVHITNKTNDLLRIIFEYTVTGTSGVAVTTKFGYGMSDFKSNIRKNDQMQFYGKCKGNEIKLEGGVSCINTISYKIIEILNLSEEERKAESTKLVKEKVAQQKKEEADKLRDTQLEKAKIAAEAKQKQDNDKVEKEKVEKEANARQEKANPSEKSKTASEEGKTIGRQAFEQDQAEQRSRDAEEEAKQNRNELQTQYETWRTQKLEQDDIRDIASAGSTFGLMYILGGYIYNNMGKVNPNLVYLRLPNKFSNLLYFNSSFGYSIVSSPILHPSQFSTYINGNSYTPEPELITTDSAYYLCLGGHAEIGLASDFYSINGFVGGSFGIDPVLNGSQSNFFLGGGASLGIKSIKIYGKYTNNFSDSKSKNFSGFDTEGQGSYSMPSTDLEYGLKFTLGGNPDDKYQRKHILIGLINRNIKIDLGLYHFNPDNHKVETDTRTTTQGFNFEFRKDHSYTIFFKAFSEYPITGNLTNKESKYKVSDANPSSSFLEFGFYRNIDAFFKKSNYNETQKNQAIQRIKEKRSPLSFTSLGIQSGLIAKYGLLFECGGENSRVGFHMAIRKSSTSDEDLLNEIVKENKLEADLGPNLRILNNLYLNIGVGYGQYKFKTQDDYLNIVKLDKSGYVESSIGLMARVGRIVSINTGLSYMDIYKKIYKPELTFGIAFNLEGKFK
jgi:hypothetical protein